MKLTLNDGAKPIIWRVQTPPKDAWLNSSLSDNEFKEFIALCNRKGDSFLSNRGRLSSAPNLLEGKHFLIAGKNKMIKIGNDLEESSVSDVIQFYGGFVYNKETKSVPKEYLRCP